MCLSPPPPSAGHKIRFRTPRERDGESDGGVCQPATRVRPLSQSLLCCESNGGKYRPDIRKEEKMDRKRSSFCPNFGGEWEMPGRARADGRRSRVSRDTHRLRPRRRGTAAQPAQLLPGGRKAGTYVSSRKTNTFYSWVDKSAKTFLPSR